MSKIITKENYEKIINFAKACGFDLVGITKPKLNEKDFEHLKNFIENKKYGNMNWFSKHKEVRLNPNFILENSKSVFVFAHYYRDQNYENYVYSSKIKISRYAIGKDYHKILKKKLKKIENFIKEIYKDIATRITVDSAPVPEKLLAKYSGIGWQGKNTNIINPKLGSYFFLSCIFTNYDYSDEIIIIEEVDHCKGCSLCIKNCPTKALSPYRLDVEKCISYWTIESKKVIEEYYAKNSKGWVFGCDICQEVCPFNKRKITKFLSTSEAEFFLRKEIKELLQNTPYQNLWENLKNSPLKRVKWDIFLANYERIKKYYS